MSIQNAGMISRPFLLCTFIRSLHFDIIFLALFVISIYIQADIPSKQIFHPSLRLHTLHMNIRLIQDDSKQ